MAEVVNHAQDTDVALIPPKHRIWDVFEVVDMITSVLPDADLLNCMLTSHGLHSVALSHLYRRTTVPRVLHLIKATILDKNWQASLSIKWERFRMYARSVRTLLVMSDSFGDRSRLLARGAGSGALTESGALFRAAADMFPVDGMFPYIRTLEVHVSDLENLRPILPVLRAPLEDLTLAWISARRSTSDDSALWSMVLALPTSLKRLAFLERWPGNPLHCLIPLQHPRALPEHLRDFLCPGCPVTDGLLQQLSGMKSLRTLYLLLDPLVPSDEDGVTSYEFPALQSVRLSGDAQSIEVFLCRTKRAPIEHVTVSTTIHPKNLLDLSKSMRSKAIREVHLILHLQIGDHEEPPSDLLHRFYPLLECHHMQDFSLVLHNDVTFPRDMDSFVQAFAPAWPDLKMLELWYTEQEANGQNPGTRALISLATHCTALQRVILSGLHIPQVLPAPPLNAGHNNNIWFSFVDTHTVERPAMFAAFLGTMWPNANVLSREDEWKYVMDALQALRWQRQVLSRPALLASSAGKSMDDISMDM